MSFKSLKSSWLKILRLQNSWLKVHSWKVYVWKILDWKVHGGKVRGWKVRSWKVLFNSSTMNYSKMNFTTKNQVRGWKFTVEILMVKKFMVETPGLKCPVTFFERCPNQWFFCWIHACTELHHTFLEKIKWVISRPRFKHLKHQPMIELALNITLF